MSAKQGEDQVGAFNAILSGKALREALRQCSHVDGFLALIGTSTHLKVAGVSSYAMACSPVPWRSTGGTLRTLIRTSPAWRRLIPTGDVALKIDGDGVPHIDTETGPIAFPTGAGFVPNVEAIEQAMAHNTVRARVGIPQGLFPADNRIRLARRVFRAEHVMLDIHGERESVRFWAPDDPCVLYVMPMGGDVAPRKGSEKAAEGSAC